MKIGELAHQSSHPRRHQGTKCHLFDWCFCCFFLYENFCSSVTYVLFTLLLFFVKIAVVLVERSVVPLTVHHQRIVAIRATGVVPAHGARMIKALPQPLPKRRGACGWVLLTVDCKDFWLPSFWRGRGRPPLIVAHHHCSRFFGFGNGQRSHGFFILSFIFFFVFKR